MVALIFSFVLTLALSALMIPVAMRRKPGTPLTWGEAMIAGIYAMVVMMLAYGIVPHQWLTFATSEWQWSKARLVFGPGDILKPKASGGWLPFTITYEAISHIVATVIYGLFLGIQVAAWSLWNKRGKAAASTEVQVSSYGRPLAKKA